jgi:hypothetical protein
MTTFFSPGFFFGSKKASGFVWWSAMAGTGASVKMIRCVVKCGGQQQHVVVAARGDRKSPAIAAPPPATVRMPGRVLCCGMRSRGADLAGVEMAAGPQPQGGVSGLFRGPRSSPRYSRVRATATVDPEDIPLEKVQAKSSGSVLPYVGVACLGAILFGYHLGVVNGALEYLAKDLGISENAVLQGWVVSTTLAGATAGSFTGGALADKFGRTRTFILDAIPLAVGAFLSATAHDVRTMIIGRLLAGIGIGISSALVPLYISEVVITDKFKLLK